MEAPLNGWKYTELGQQVSINVPFTLQHSDSNVFVFIMSNYTDSESDWRSEGDFHYFSTFQIGI